MITRPRINAELLMVGGAVMTVVIQACEQTKDNDAISEGESLRVFGTQAGFL